jgi:hypothetical protein
VREVTFITGTVVTPQYLNDRQDIEGPTAWGVRVIQASNTVVSVPIANDGSATGSTTIVINGYPRLITSPVALPISGAAQIFDIYATILGQLITDGFTIQAVTHNTASPANSRKIAEVDWNGASITAIRNLIDAVPGHNGEHAVGGLDPVTPAAIGTLTADQIAAAIQQALAAGAVGATSSAIYLPGDLIYTSATVRAGAIFCNGQAVSRTGANAALNAIAAAAGYQAPWGPGNGSTTFNVPNYVDVVLVGAGGSYGLGVRGGATTAIADLAPHRHPVNIGEPGHGHGVFSNTANNPAGGPGSAAAQWTFGGAEYVGAVFNTLDLGNTNNVLAGAYSYAPDGGGNGVTSLVGSGGGHNNMQPYAAVNVFVKT